MAWFYGWMYCANTYLAFMVGRDGVYSILAWGEKEGDFPLSTFQIFSYSIWGGMTVIHASLYAFDQVSFTSKQIKFSFSAKQTIHALFRFDGKSLITSRIKSKCKSKKSPAVVHKLSSRRNLAILFMFTKTSTSPVIPSKITLTTVQYSLYLFVLLARYKHES